MIDEKMCVKQAKSAFSVLLGLKPAEINGKPLFDLASGALNSEPLRSTLNAMVNDGQPVQNFEIVSKFKNGTIPLRIQANASDDRSNNRQAVLLLQTNH